jgi:predicted nucleic acid-binding protein
VWTWARDRRFPHLAEWFNAKVAEGRVLVCDLVVLELTRLAPNEARAREVAERLDAFKSVPMQNALWDRAREVQLLLAPEGNHRRVPPADLLLAAAAERADVPLVHYDRDYERIAAVADLRHEWLVEDGSLA